MERVEGVYGLDEGRFGLKVWLRQRWCPLGERPPWVYSDEYEWVWVYAAIEPLTAESFLLLLPWVTPECVQVFLDRAARACSWTEGRSSAGWIGQP